MKTAYAALAAMNILVVLAIPFIIKIYGLSAEASEYAYWILIYHSACVVTIWPLSFSLPNTLRAAADVKFAMILSIISMWIFRIGFSVVLGVYLHWGVFGVWVAMTIGLAVPRGKLYHSIRKRKVETGSAGLARIGK